MYKIVKVIDPFEEPKASPQVSDAINTLSGECYQSGPDGFVPFDVVENPTGEGEGLGWITDEEALAITDWIKEHGVEVGDSVLIQWSY